MLTVELLKQQKSLSGLSDDVLAVIADLSTKDETTVIDKKVGEMYREMDAKILEITGVKRNGAEKTYDYYARATKEIKLAADGVAELNTKIEELGKEKIALEEKLKNSGTEEAKGLKAQLAQKDADLNQVKKEYTTLKAEHTLAEEKYNSDLLAYQKSSYLMREVNSFSFRDDLEPEVILAMKERALAKVGAYDVEFSVKDGVESMVFKENGATKTNPNNGLNPYTANEILQDFFGSLNILKANNKDAGAGTVPPGKKTAGDKTVNVNLSGVKTKDEADRLIIKTLLDQGVSKHDPEFQKMRDTAWKENNIVSLPSEDVAE